ncbi:hypothetical protein BKA57DRAFT_541057 [Linnemannia elongata]|nr:hypothetical protein BKA57DRAFT_541057 [Linnemannia elongata]
MVTSGTNVGEDYFSEDMKQAYAAEFAGQSLHMGYIAIKISLQQCRAKRVVLALSPMLETLRNKHMVLHDIDMTRDCRYVTERRLVESSSSQNRRRISSPPDVTRSLQHLGSPLQSSIPHRFVA